MLLAAFSGCDGIGDFKNSRRAESIAKAFSTTLLALENL